VYSTSVCPLERDSLELWLNKNQKGDNFENCTTAAGNLNGNY